MPEEGDLRVWWIPQVPMHSFRVDVPNIETAILIIKVLEEYDLFQFDNNIKPDYTNAGGIQRWVNYFDGEEDHWGWTDVDIEWEIEEGFLNNQ